MKTTKKALSLDTQTIRVLDNDQLAGVNGGAFVSNWMPCVSNNGGGKSCLGYCPGAAPGGGGDAGGGAQP